MAAPRVCARTHGQHWEWDLADDYKHGNRVCRDPKGTPEWLDQYLLVGTQCGVCQFGVEEQATE